MASRLTSFFYKVWFVLRESTCFQSLKEGDLACGAFLDMSKGFDYINYELILIKLYKYGVRGKALRICSYLKRRKQFVEIEQKGNKIRLGASELSEEVQQGSILRPLLFIIYVNYIKNVISNSNQQ